jgi:hypothetical protein
MTPFSSIPSPSLTNNFFLLAIHLTWGPKRAVQCGETLPVQRPHNSDEWVGWLSLHREEGLSSCTVLYLTRSGRGAMLFSVPGLGRRDWWLSRARRQNNATQRKGTAICRGSPAPVFQAVRQGLLRI